MAESKHLREFKAVWGASCQSMWAELLSLTIAETHLLSSYSQIPHDRLVCDLFYAPELKKRLNDLKKDTFLSRVDTYRATVITNRIVILSASFESYFSSFLDQFIKSKPKYFDKAAGTRTPAGDKLYGETIKTRGLTQRIEKFAELANAKIGIIKARTTYLDDVYILRNVLAHAAGSIDAHSASSLQHLTLPANQRISITSEQLLSLAAKVVEIAESLDKKI